MRRQQTAHGGLTNGPGSQRSIPAPPAAPLHGLQAQVWGRRDRPSGKQGIDELAEGVATPLEGGVHRRTAGRELIKRRGFHAAHYGTAYRLPAMPALLGLQHQLRACFERVVLC